jgi:hypothetical protein
LNNTTPPLHSVLSFKVSGAMSESSVRALRFVLLLLRFTLMLTTALSAKRFGFTFRLSFAADLAIQRQ